jgi:hypothetical protein
MLLERSLLYAVSERSLLYAVSVRSLLYAVSVLRPIDTLAVFRGRVIMHRTRICDHRCMLRSCGGQT